jgi:glycosyltransferase involved in cell wall biosynthesis
MIAHVHALETDRAGDHARNEIYWLERQGLEIADHIISVSEYTRDQIIRHYEIDPRKITVVHNGIDPAPITRKKHHLKDKLVVFLGRITQQKGPYFLLETAEKVVRVYPRVKFVVAGMGDQFAHLLEQTAYKKLGSKFIFAGFLTKSKVDELLAMADVYFMPSISEPFGLTALEAAQHLVPSVISSQSGAAEVVTSTLQADFWDTDKYANYIHALLKYDALGKELSRKALSQLDKLSWDHAAQKFMVVYKSLSKI